MKKIFAREIRERCEKRKKKYNKSFNLASFAGKINKFMRKNAIREANNLRPNK